MKNPAPSVQNRLAILWAARTLAALALVVAGGLHLEQYTVADFSVVPTVGPLFLVDFIAATIVGLVLLVPIRRSAGPVRLRFESLAVAAPTFRPPPSH